MKVWQLILKLSTMPLNAMVLHVWDGHARTRIKHVWLSRIGDVITADDGEVVYGKSTRPIWLTGDENNDYWETPGGFWEKESESKR